MWWLPLRRDAIILWPYESAKDFAVSPFTFRKDLDAPIFVEML